jgi:hypothetical protein
MNSSAVLSADRSAHRRYEEFYILRCLLQKTSFCVRFEIFTAVFLRSVRRLLVTASVVPSSPILVTLMMEELSPSETSVLTRATRRNIPEDILLVPIVRGVYKQSLWPLVRKRNIPTDRQPLVG